MHNMPPDHITTSIAPRLNILQVRSEKPASEAGTMKNRVLWYLLDPFAIHRPIDSNHIL